MEESEKRRERLKAMRMEAAQSGENNTESESSLSSSSHGLSNPLIESEAAASTPVQYSSPRFDYYTDPMSAFSANKKRNNVPPQVSQGYYNAPPRPIYQTMTPLPPHQNFQAPGPHFNPNPPGSAMRAPLVPSGTTRGNPPIFHNSSYSPNFPRGGGNFTVGNSPYLNQGRGRGGNTYNSGGGPQYDYGNRSFRNFDSGRGRGRSIGSGSRDSSVSAEVRPNLYYKKEMAEDPWKLMSPVVWKAVNFDKSWVPKSVSVKKAKGYSESGSQKSVSQPSLAEYLATSFKDAGNDSNEAFGEPGI